MKELSLNRKAFFRDLGYKPHPGQQLVHGSHAQRRVLACGVRWGKSVAAAMEALAAAMEPRARSVGWVVAPTYDLADKVFREVLIRAQQHFPQRIIREQAHLYSLQIHNLGGGVSEIRGKSAENPASLLGEGLNWCVVDEAARLKPRVWDSYLSQRLLDKRGWALLISTPKGKGWFYHHWKAHLHDEGYESWNSPSWDNPHLHRPDIEKERDRLPERVFRQEYGAEFIEGAGSVFRNVQQAATGEWEEPVKGGRYVFGLDLARVQDYTVLAIIRVPDAAGRVTEEEPVYPVVFADRFQGLDWKFQVHRLSAALDRYGNPCGLVDSTGVGDPILQQLREAGVNANPYQFSNRTKNELLNNAALMFEKGQVQLPRIQVWPEAVEEFESFEYSVSDAGNVKSSAPPGMHDDIVMGVSLALLEAKKYAPMEVQWV